MPQDNQTYRETATTHIRALSALSERLPPILSSASTAISQLTNAPIPASSSDPDTPATRRATLHASSISYFAAVLELARDLHQQVTDLETAGVIPAEEVKYVARAEEASTKGPQALAKDSEAGVTNGGLGEFDVGVLNARAGVRERGQEEVMERVKRLLEDLEGRTSAEGKGEKMDVDAEG